MIQKTGGVLVALRYAEDWGKCGHDVHVYYPLFLSHYHIRHKNPIIKALSFLRYGWKNWQKYRAFQKGGWLGWAKGSFQIHLAWRQSTACLPKADATIATAWTTAYWAVKNREKAGKCCYFIQHYETWDGHEDLVQNTFRLGMHNVVIAPWLEDIVKQYSPNQPLTLIPNGVDTGVFSLPLAPRVRSGILAMYHESPIKGMDVIARLFEDLHQKYPEKPLRMFGLNTRPQTLAPYVEYAENPEPTHLADLYRDSEFYVSACESEGWGLTILEALACGCIPFSPLTGCVPLVNKTTELVQVFGAKDVNAVVGKMESLWADHARAEGLSLQGAVRAKDFAWEPSFAQFRKIIEDL